MYKNKLRVKMIVAVSANNCIGKDGDLVLTNKEDFQRFKHFTKAHNVIMGRKTFDSLPKKPLPERGNFYITNSLDLHYDIDLIEYIDDKYPGFCVTSGNSLEELIDYFNRFQKDKELWVIGGGSIYKQFLDIDGLVDEIQITRWKESVDGDTFFPNLDKNVWVRKYITYPQHTCDFVFETWLRNEGDKKA